MHVAINGWFWDQPNTGSGQYVRRLTAALRKIAPELRLTLILPPHIESPDDVPNAVDVLHGKGFGGKLGKVWFEQRTFPRLVGRSGADIAHVPYWGPPLSSPAKLVTSVLDVIPLVLPEYAAGFGAKLYTSLVTAAARGSSHTITLSEAAKSDIVQHIGLPPESITPIYLGVDEAFHPRMGAERDAEVRAKYNLPEEFTLCISGFDRRKRIDLLLTAYTYVRQAYSDQYPLVLAGREPQWGANPALFPDMRRLAATLELEDTVQWIGYVDEADKPSLYRLARVVVFPSEYEGFGLPVIEAMASGTPVIAQNIDVFREIVGDGAYLVDNEREMAGAIMALLTQDSLHKTMVNQGLAQATRFNWRKTARETLTIYENLLSS